MPHLRPQSNDLSEFRSDEARMGSSGGTPEFDCDLVTSEPKCESASAKVELCHPQPVVRKPRRCFPPKKWQHGVHARDECGSGIVAKRLGVTQSRNLWCKTPLTMYQATIGELGRKILCREKILQRDVNSAPPCNVCEFILPPCRGYYRKYDCLRPCEEEAVVYEKGRKRYRDRVARYWNPCTALGTHTDINTYAPHNVFLGSRVARKAGNVPCW